MQCALIASVNKTAYLRKFLIDVGYTVTDNNIKKRIKTDYNRKIGFASNIKNSVINFTLTTNEITPPSETGSQSIQSALINDCSAR